MITKKGTQDLFFEGDSMNEFDRRTVVEKMSEAIPQYHDTMYIEGYTPNEILQSKRAQMRADQQRQREEVHSATQKVQNLNITVNGKVVRKR